MIADLKPYSDYKDSGLPWLARMPGHWDTQRSKYLFREADQRSAEGTEQRMSMSQRHGLIPSSQIEERRLVSESSVGGKICEAGDLVLNRLKAHLGVVAISPTRGVVSPDYTVLRPVGETNHHYFCAVYRSPHCGQELRRRAKGIVEGFWRLYTDDFYDIRVPVPPPDEQAAIVRFLDWANGQLDRTIRAKRKTNSRRAGVPTALLDESFCVGARSTRPSKHRTIQRSRSCLLPGWLVPVLRRTVDPGLPVSNWAGKPPWVLSSCPDMPADAHAEGKFPKAASADRT